MRLHLQNEGNAGFRGGRNGDLYVVMHVQEHAIFERDGLDLYCEMKVPYTQMVLGGDITVPTITASEQLTIPPGTQPGTVFRLRGKGVPDVNRRRHPGDIQVLVQVQVPTSVSDEQRHVLKDLAALSGEEAGHGKGLFSRLRDRLK
jgi:molecular chaperone DnaJ